MKKGKHIRKKFKILEIYSVLILVATLFMSIGYAEISDITLTIDGKTEATAQDGIFITDITYLSDINTEEANSKINYFVGTLMDSCIVLGNSADSEITYEVQIHNKYDKEYVFIGVITDTSDSTLYSNSNIGYSLNNITPHVTTISPNETITFSITFKYKNTTDLNNNTLFSKLNFRFQELPKLVLSNDGETYELNNIYPDYTPHEYTFTISNYDESTINNVPMTYSLATTIDAPLTTKIYDSSGNEVTGNITINGDGTTKVDHTYTLKIIWDNTNISNNINYDAPEYANKTFNCSVSLNAIPDSDKYLDYAIEKGFNTNITSAPFYFHANAKNASVETENNTAIFSIIINNYDSTTAYNLLNTSYEIVAADDKFSISVEDSHNGILQGGSAIDNEVKITCTILDGTSIDSEEEINLTVRSIDPYVREFNLTLYIRANAYLGLSGFETITSDICSNYASFQGTTYEQLYSGNNGQIEYSSDNGIVFDEDNPILYLDFSNTSDAFSDAYSIYVTLKADLSQSESYGNTIISIGNAEQADYLSWISVYQGYLHVYSYYKDSAFPNWNQESVTVGFASYDISQYTNTIFNLQVVATRGGQTTVYLNGTPLTSTAEDGSTVTGFTSGSEAITCQQAVIGDLRPLRGLKFQGTIYDFEIYDRALTEAEVQTNWNYSQDTWIY